ncbi:MAG TPA: alpha/beta fold hydrolase, partial [Longimicrobium sp.]
MAPDAFDPRRRTHMPSPVRLALAAALVAAGLAACAPGASVPAGSPPPPAASAPTSLAAAPDQFFQAGAARLRYREAGRGEAVIFLHGALGRLESWTTLGVGDSLAREHRVAVLDQRGFGESSRFDTPAGYGLAMADDVIRLLDHLQLRRAHLVGHSMGAVVAANVAARYPDRVVSATLIAPPEYA